MSEKMTREELIDKAVRAIFYGSGTLHGREWAFREALSALCPAPEAVAACHTHFTYHTPSECHLAEIKALRTRAETAERELAEAREVIEDIKRACNGLPCSNCNCLGCNAARALARGGR